MPVTTEISRDPRGYPDRRLHRNYRYFMNQTHIRTVEHTITRN